MNALIVDDHELFADALRALLARMEIEVLAVATSGEGALALQLEPDPDLVLVDLGLPDQSGLALGRALIQRYPESKVVILTALEDQGVVEEAARQGFHGYLVKDMGMTQFAEALRGALDGRPVFPRLLTPLGGAPRGRRDDHSRLLAERLTMREREVLALLVEGASGPSVARRLGISSNTVRTHVQSILTKLQVHSRLEAAAFAVRHGIVEVPGATRAG